MKWMVVAVAALVAVVAANVALLRYGGDRHDPVGRLTPVTSIPVRSPSPPPVVTTADDHHEDD